MTTPSEEFKRDEAVRVLRDLRLRFALAISSGMLAVTKTVGASELEIENRLSPGFIYNCADALAREELARRERDGR